MINKELLMMGGSSAKPVKVTISYSGYRYQEQTISYTDTDGNSKSNTFYDEVEYMDEFTAMGGTTVTFKSGSVTLVQNTKPSNLKTSWNDLQTIITIYLEEHTEVYVELSRI